MFKCPVCKASMPTNDVNDADYVALGEVVCSFLCHIEMYSGQFRLPFDLNEEHDWHNEVRSHIDDP